MGRSTILRGSALAVLTAAALFAGSNVQVLRTPNDGLQPRAAVDSKGVLHLVYYQGESGHGDLVYVRSNDGGRTYSDPIPVNSPGSAVAGGTIRGAQIALGRNDRLHVAWNGSSKAKARGPLNPEQPADSPHNGTPMLYTRLGDDGEFEPEKNLMTKTFGLDGGGTIAADSEGRVYVAWHGKALGAAEGEAGRMVWLTVSTDDGATFSEERAISDPETGACGCCGMRIFVDSEQNVLALYRSAREVFHRDTYLLASSDHGKTFRSRKIDKWKIGGCPMSSMWFSEGDAGLLAGWETAGQVIFGRLDAGSLKAKDTRPAPGIAEKRKHPSIAQNADGEVLLAWTEVGGWGKGGSVSWQRYDRKGRPTGPTESRTDLPAWSFGTALLLPDGSFAVIY